MMLSLKNVEILNDTGQSIAQSLSGARTYRYYEYKKNTADVKSLCGEITVQEITGNLSEEGSQAIPGHEIRQPDPVPALRATERRIQNVSQLNCRG